MGYYMLILCCSCGPHTETAFFLWLILPAVTVVLVIFLLALLVYYCKKRARKYVQKHFLLKVCLDCVTPNYQVYRIPVLLLSGTF